MPKKGAGSTQPNRIQTRSEYRGIISAQDPSPVKEIMLISGRFSQPTLKAVVTFYSISENRDTLSPNLTMWMMDLRSLGANADRAIDFSGSNGYFLWEFSFERKTVPSDDEAISIMDKMASTFGCPPPFHVIVNRGFRLRIKEGGNRTRLVEEGDYILPRARGGQEEQS